MLIDARELPDHGAVEADVCVVGAGAAGIAIARELIGEMPDVCVLESGGPEPEAETQALCRGENAGLPYFPLDENRCRALGGTTALWAGWCRPLDRLDFEQRSWVPESGWPVSRSELLPYYERAHELFELGPFEYDVALWERVLNLRHLPLDPEQVVTRVYHLSPPTRFGETYRTELAAARNVRILQHANALELETTESRNAVIGLRAGCLGGKRFRVVAKHFVLAAGAIENARLLLLSGRDRRVTLGNEHDLVGRYFMEHLHFPSGVVQLDRSVPLALYSPNGGPVVARLFLPPEAQAREGLLNYAAGIEPLRDRTLLLARLRARVTGPRPPRALGLNHTLEQAPNRESRVTLSSEHDDLDQPRARLEWRLSELDRRTFLRAQQLVGEAFARAGLGRLRVEPGDNDTAWPPEPLQGLRGHHMGTTRMSSDPSRGVVDEHCRVHGVANLSIAGSSVFPTSGAGTPTLTIVALALRLADRLAALTPP